MMSAEHVDVRGYNALVLDQEHDEKAMGLTICVGFIVGLRVGSNIRKIVEIGLYCFVRYLGKQ